MRASMGAAALCIAKDTVMLAAMRWARTCRMFLRMRIFLAVPFRQLDDFKGDRGDSGADHVEFAGGAF